MTEFQDRLKVALFEEWGQPLCWWYLSFADKEFRGVVVVEAHGIVSAVMRTHELGINPGGEALGMALPPGEEPAPEFRDKLLSKLELKRAFGELARVDSNGELQEIL